MADDAPIFQPNTAAIMLLERIAADQTRLADAVLELQRNASRLDGLNLDQRLRDQAAELKEALRRIGELEGERRADHAQRRPWLFLAGELAKLVLAGGGAALAAIFALGGHHR